MIHFVTESSNYSPNGHVTRSLSMRDFVKRKTVCVSQSSNYWSSTENNMNNCWNVNFNNGNTNNNNKYNTNYVRALVAFSELEKIDWINAFYDCCRTKMTSKQCTLYRLHYEDDLFRLAMEVKSHTYVPSLSTTFIVTKPKLREIFAANFRDRIVQHWIILKLNPLIEDRFQQQGNVSYNCRVGFGTLAAVELLSKNIYDVSCGYTKQAYIGKFDLKSFFMSVDIEILWQKLEQFIKEKYHDDDIDDLLYTTKTVIFHRPQLNCKKQGLDLWDLLEKSKSLFNIDGYVGMPIGNITSQIFANFYMSFFDLQIIDYCKEHNGRYIRFVDDFVIVFNDIEDIKYIRKFAQKWLSDNLNIQMHSKKIYIQPAYNGVNFVGSVIKPNRIYLINRTYGGFLEALTEADIICRNINDSNIATSIHKLQYIQCVVNSYLGFTVHNKSYNIKRKLFLRCSNLWKFFDIDMDLSKLELKKQFKIKRIVYDKYRDCTERYVA